MPQIEFDELANELGSRVLAGVKGKLTAEWAAWDDGIHKQIAAASFDLAKLYFYDLLGYDVAAEALHAKARLANWTWVAANKVVEALKEAFAEALAIGAKVAVKALLA